MLFALLVLLDSQYDTDNYWHDIVKFLSKHILTYICI